MKRFLFSSMMILAISFLFLACAPTLKKVEVSDPAVQAEREKQQRIYAENVIKQQTRLFDISGPILCESAEFAPKDKVQTYYGFYAMQRDVLSKDMKQAYIDIYKLGAFPRVIHISPESPAEKAGVLQGDEIKVVNGRPVTGMDYFEILKHERKNSKEIKLQVARGTEIKEIRFEGLSSYACPVLISSDQRLNAYADGEKVIIFMGIMNTLSDEEVSIIVGHEVSHNLLEHLSKKRGNAALGTVADVLVSGLLSAVVRAPISTRGAFSDVGAMAYSTEFEGEADYLGLYLAARTGLDISQAADLWRKMAVTNPGSIKEKSYFSSHPSSPERYLIMEKTIMEIEEKRATNKPLVPDKKE